MMTLSAERPFGAFGPGAERARGKLAQRRMRLGNMSIQALMTAADAAGYVMVSEDELPDTFGRKPSLFDFKSVPSTSLAIWRPVMPRADGASAASVHGHASHAWHWLTDRFHTGATA